MKWTLFLLLVLLIIEEAFLYSSAPQQEPLSHRPENTNELARERLLYFDIGLLDEIRSQTKRNFVISPLSIKLMLSLILETAKGNSANEIRRSLSLSDDLNIAQKQLLLPPRVFKTANTTLLLKSGNAVYISHYLTPKKEYQQAIEKKYSASVQQVDFSNSQVAARTINNWVSRVTAGLIPTIVNAGALPPNTQMVLVNAVYFKGIWKNTFPESRTEVKPFKVSPTETVYTNMMYNKNLYRYKVAPEVSAELIHIPFQDENFRLVVMLPTGQSTIENLLRDLKHSRLINTLNSEELQEVVLELPRFKIDYETELTNILKQLRITEIFTDNAQLENMVEGTNQKLRLSKVIQKATIEVNEQGAEAAAATGAVVEPLMKPAHEPISFIVNRPFVYFIYNSQYKVILFEGCVMKPELASKGPNAPPQSYKPPQPPVTTETSPNYQPPIDERIQNPQEYQPPINNNVVYNNNNNNQQIPSELFPSHQQNPQTAQQGSYQQPSNLVPITRPNVNQIRPTLPVNQASAPPPPPIANLSPRTQYTRNYRTESTLVFPSSK